MRLLVTRPAPAATAARLRAMGHDVTEAPLLVTMARAWAPPPRPPQAIAFTSATGIRLAGAGQHLGLPVFAVGAATAAAARAAGHADVRDGGGTAQSLFDRVAAAGFTDVLHLAGAERTPVVVPPGLTIDVRTVYAAVPADLPQAVLAALAAGAIDLVPLYSARTAVRFAAQVDAAGIDRAGLDLAAISPAAAAAAGPGWRSLAVAMVPTEDGLFAEIGWLCDKPVDSAGESGPEPSGD